MFYYFSPNSEIKKPPAKHHDLAERNGPNSALKPSNEANPDNTFIMDLHPPEL